MIRTNCVIYNNITFIDIYKRDNYPLLMNPSTSTYENDIYENNNFIGCTRCGCVQLKNLTDPNKLYMDSEYITYNTPTWKRHHNAFCNFIINEISENTNIFEIGGSNGILAKNILNKLNVNYNIIDIIERIPNIPGVNYIKGNCETLDFYNNNDTSSTIIISHLFEYLYKHEIFIKNIKNKNIKKIVLTRPVVTVDEEIGFLPGDINRKMDPWTRPIFDIFLEVFSQRELDLMIQNAVIEICPLAFMRGRTFKNSFILSDEMQNSTPNQMMLIATRIGDGSKMVITGDLRQSDRKDENGLNHFLNKIDTFEKKGGELTGVRVCMLENKDIERSPIVAQVLNIWSGNVLTPFLIYNADKSAINELKGNDTFGIKNAERCNTNSTTTKKNEKSEPLFWIPPASNHSKSSLDAALIPAESLPKSFNGSICNL